MLQGLNPDTDEYESKHEAVMSTSWWNLNLYWRWLFLRQTPDSDWITTKPGTFNIH